MQAAELTLGPRLFSRWHGSSREEDSPWLLPSAGSFLGACFPPRCTAQHPKHQGGLPILLGQGTRRTGSPKSKTRETPRFRSRGTGNHNPSAHHDCHTWSPGPCFHILSLQQVTQVGKGGPRRGCILNLGSVNPPTSLHDCECWSIVLGRVWRDHSGPQRAHGP